MNRRNFLHQSGAALACLAFPPLARAETARDRKKSPAERAEKATWQTVECTTIVRTQAEAGTRLWLPMPLGKTSYQEHSDTLWSGSFARAAILKDHTYGAPMFFAEWDKAGPLELDLSFRVKIRDRSGIEAGSPGDEELYLQPCKHIPIDSALKLMAQKINRGVKDPDQRAKKIYDWMVENTVRDAKVLGCGTGDIKALLEEEVPHGKCVDLSSLFVGLCRASGIPAREVFGLRVSPSRFSKSIGKEGDVTGGQHCRAEFYSTARKGWVAVDPADVRKVMLEENLGLSDQHVQDLRRKFFGFWEMNWVAFNSARDFLLPPGNETTLNYLMYPYYSSAGGTKDGIDAKEFQYSIHAKVS
jgi:transglutaminase-like putative cysteine protease